MKKTILLAALALLTMTGFAQAQDKPIRLCTGTTTGAYFNAGKVVKKFAGESLNIELINTTGSIDNINQAIEDKCDAFISQPDSLVEIQKKTPSVKRKFRGIANLHKEYLQVICNTNSGIDDLSDLEGTTLKVDVGEPNSGSWSVWQNIVAEDSGYATVKTVSDGGDSALAAVSQGDIACMLVTSAIGTDFMNSANAEFQDIRLVGANDKDFNDAVGVDDKPLYEFAEISSDNYDKLLSGWFADIETISWRAKVYANTDTLTKDQLNKIIKASTRASGEIRSMYDK